jgi:hypothetical protein
MSFSDDFCMLSGRCLCVRPITRPEESYRVCECDLGASIMRRPWPTGGCFAMEKKTYFWEITSFNLDRVTGCSVYG